MKNASGQALSHIRTLRYGNYFCDFTQARQFGLPPNVLGRENAQSDKAQAVLMNPFFLVSEAVSGCFAKFNILFVHKSHLFCAN